MCRDSLQARHFFRADMEQGRDYFISFVMHLFQPDDEDSLKRQTPHLWWWSRMNHSRLSRQSTIKCRDDILIGYWLQKCKPESSEGEGQWRFRGLAAMRFYCVRAQLMQPITATCILILVLRVTKEIPAAHFQCLQDCHTSTALTV